MKQSYKAPRIIFLTLVVLGLFAGTISSQNKQFGLISVENKTRSLTVVSIENKGPIHEFKERGLGDLSRYDVKLRNDYDKSIAVYQLRGLAEFTGVTIVNAPGTFLTKWIFKPGETMTTNFVASTGGRIRLTAEAVVFEDGSGDGDPAIIAALQKQRLGTSIAYQQLVPLFRDALKSETLSVTPAKVEELIRGVETIYPEKDATADVVKGLESAKSTLKLFLRGTLYFMNQGDFPKTWQSLPDKLTEMETGLKRFSETTPVKTASLRKR